MSNSDRLGRGAARVEAADIAVLLTSGVSKVICVLPRVDEGVPRNVDISKL